MDNRKKQELLDLLRQHPEWKVLDVGAHSQPLMLATHSIDINPWETSGDQGVIGTVEECRIRDNTTWTIQDICNTPWPYPDKYFDFVFCSNVIEDIKDPVRVVQEIVRVGKAGYIEYPNPAWEMQRNVEPHLDESKYYYGYFHHRWLIHGRKDEDGQRLYFLPKLSCVNAYDILVEAPEKHFIGTYWKDEIWTAENHIFDIRAFSFELNKMVGTEVYECPQHTIMW